MIKRKENGVTKNAETDCAEKWIDDGTKREW